MFNLVKTSFKLNFCYLNNESNSYLKFKHFIRLKLQSFSVFKH